MAAAQAAPSAIVRPGPSPFIIWKTNTMHMLSVWGRTASWKFRHWCTWSIVPCRYLFKTNFNIIYSIHKKWSKSKSWMCFYEIEIQGLVFHSSSPCETRMCQRKLDAFFHTIPKHFGEPPTTSCHLHPTTGAPLHRAGVAPFPPCVLQWWRLKPPRTRVAVGLGWVVSSQNVKSLMSFEGYTGYTPPLQKLWAYHGWILNDGMWWS